MVFIQETNIDGYKSVGTQWKPLHVKSDNLTYFHILAEYILKEIKKFVGNKNITANIYRIQAYSSIMRG